MRSRQAWRLHAATFAARGLNIIGVDIDPEKIQKVNAGEPPVDEPSLAETIKEGRERLRATDDPAETVKNGDSRKIMRKKGISPLFPLSALIRKFQRFSFPRSAFRFAAFSVFSFQRFSFH